MANNGLFVGLVTLDLIYLAESGLRNNQKIVSADYTVAAGGPATNAAVTFAYLGNKAQILGVVGSHPMTQLIKSDLADCNVEIVDLDPTTENPPSVSSIIVTQSTGERAVISINAVKTQVNSKCIQPNIIQNINSQNSQNSQNVNIILIDGHQMAVGYEIAQMAKSKNIPVVIDGGSWKPGFEKILPFVDYAICSANFYPPSCQNTQDVFHYLSCFGIPYIAITRSEKAIEYVNYQAINTILTIEVPIITAIDTLGAGDIFHGAFCHYILYLDFSTALQEAAKIAAMSCQFFGTRRWMENTTSTAWRK
ncbi:MAG: sugar kinase [Calothrix sp. SM1_7_51]|nr:sugar kinase [Calothrix sp. SM1_7_51]